MPLEDNIESRCDECDTPLVQLDGRWFCLECNEVTDFNLVPERDEFAL